jgi:hypothetical protein
MRTRLAHSLLCLVFLAVLCTRPSLAASTAEKARFERLFDRRSLDGWVLVNGKGPGYVVRDGVLVCPPDGGGNLLTAREYSDFILRFEFKLAPGGNSGVALRAPREGDAAYVGMESQILDDSSPSYSNLEPGQFHGSIYKVAPAKRGALRRVGRWNREEIQVRGRRIKVTVNGRVTVDADLNAISDPAVLAAHPGFQRERGHVGFCGHGPSEVQFRNIFIADLGRPEQDNVPPEGFTNLFNGRDLSGWKGLVADPPARAGMTREQLTDKEKAATEEALKHWKATNGVITYDGRNNSLVTARDYGDFELLVDWKTEPGGDSGIYLRGSPQIQIWDSPLGSGGLYNNQKNPSNPARRADRPAGEWNRFRILMVGDKVTVHLNGELVTHNVTMENYWERDKPIYPTGAIELQHHGAPLYFKNIFVREIPRSSPLAIP